MKRASLSRGLLRSLLSKNAFHRRPVRRPRSLASALERIEDLECRTLLSATPTLTVTDANGTFTGKPFVATVSATVNNSPIPIGQSLNFSTYLGSNSTSRAFDVATDSLGNTFVTGRTSGTGFPTTTGAYETTGAADGSSSAFVAKFDPSGNLVWSTLIDGASGYAIAIDGSDNVYVAGEASQTDFQTTTGAFQTAANAGTNAFIAKLNPSGSSVIWATFLGGTAFGEVDGIAIDSADNVYVAGDTTATNFPLKNPVQAQNNGGSDAFITELNSAGSQLVFSTYLGGSGDDYPSAIALDAAGDIFTTGSTDSTDLATTSNALQPTYGGASSDAFVAKLNPSGAGLAYLTYLGGSADVYGSDFEMAVDAAGDAYVVGTTDADTIPMVNAYQSTYEGGQDAFIAELNPSGTAILNSTYFGSNTYASSIAMDSSGNVYIGGDTSGGTVPTVDPAYTTGDLFGAELNLSNATLVYSTYLGPTSDSTLVTPVGVTSNGNIIVTGDTTSTSFPTLNATQSSLTGFRDAFVMGLEPELTVSYYAGATATGTPLPGAPSAVGTYTVVATFTSTDPNYTNAQSGPVTFTISQGQPLTPNVTALDQSGAYDGSPFTATATAVNSDGQPVSGTFDFTYYVGSSATGTGTSTPPVDAGTYTVVAAFTSTDPNYADAQSAPLAFTISPATTNTSVVASTATSVYGQSITLTATVASPGGTPTAGTVTFYNGATSLGTTGINNGVASLPTTTLTVGFDVVTATYNGDGLDFAGSSSVLSPASLIQTVAGTGVAGFNGNGIAATSAEINFPAGIVTDSKGDLFFVDSQISEVREVNATTHLITVVAGTGVAGYNGDGIAATSAELNFPSGLAIDSEGDLFIADQDNQRIREVNAVTGLISTVAGNGGTGYNGDGIAATSADLNVPDGVAVDSQGNVYIADILNNRVREVSATTGLISTIAGTGTAGYNGNDIAASSAELNLPRGVAVDAAGDVFISDSRNNLVREYVVSTGDLVNVAGTGAAGYNGDGIAATSAELNFPIALAVDSSGNLFIGDNAGQRVREVSATTGLISTVAGTGVSGYNGDGIAAGSAELSNPFGIAVDSVDDLFIADSSNNRVREVASGATSITITAATPTVAINSAGGTFTGSPLPADATVAGVVPGVDNTPGSTLEGVPLTFTYYAGTDATGTPLSGPPTDIGTYTVVASFPGSQDYTSASATDTYSISSASNSQQTPVISVSDPSGTFTGQPFVATVSATVNNTPIPIAQSLNFSTYLGSSTTSRAINVITDDFGNTFVVGWTTGTGFPTTAGAYETTGAADGSRSAFVAKFDPSGNLVWSTLIDGASGFAIAVDGSDNVYVGGDASPTDFQTTSGAYQTTASTNNAFIAKLNPSGSSLIWATYLGGNNFGEVDGIAVDNAGNVYVAGDTTATNFPLKNPIQSQNNGGSDAFVSELNSTGSQLVFSTYGGGSGDDFPSAIALDAAGDIFVTGTTDSTDLPTTANAIQPTYGGGDSDAFVAKLDPSGAGLVYLTYLGGSGDVTGSDVEMAVDAAGDAYVVGTTDADTIPMVNAYQSTYSGGQDAFIAELNPSGTAILNSTYFGSGTYASGMALDSQGNVYVAGPEFDSVPTVDPASTSGDLYVAEINLSSSTLVYSTTLGATDDNSIITPVGVTSNGNIILTGDTTSESFPTQNAYQSSLTGSRDAFVTGLQPELTVSYYAGTTATGTLLPGAPSAAGTYTVVATFTSTDPNYTDAQSDPVTFTISPAGPVTPTVTAFDSSGVYDGNPFTATATAQGPNGGPASGTFAFTYYDGVSATGTGSSTPPVDAGTYTVVASFDSSDPDFTDAQSAPVTFTISPASTATSVSASASTETYGGSETLAATITSRAGTPDGGTVTFFDGTTPLGTASVTNGTASLTTTALPAGLDVVSANYSGDGLDFSGSTSVLTPSSIIQTVAGTGVEGSNPGGIPATSANLFFPSGLAVDSAGDIYIADEQNNVVQEVNAKTGLITTIAGTGTAGYNGDGIAATSAELNFPSAVHFDAAGDLFIVDARNNRIREVNAKTGLISTVVGTGTAGYNGDGIAPISAELNFPLDITFDSSGNLYITDSGNNRVREVNASTGLISTIAGTGTAGYNGDGISSASAELNEPDGIAVDTAGDVFVTEVFGERVREISAATGLIGTIAGTGTYGYNGDGIAAISAQLAEPEAVVLDAAGNIYIADAGNSRIREIDASTGLISTVVGTATDGYNGDGIPADTAELVQPADLAFDSAGDLFIADLGNSRVREVSTVNAFITVTPAIPTVTASDPGGTFNGGPFAATATVAGVVAGVDNTPSSSLEGVSLTLTYYAGTTATGTPLPGAPSAAGAYTVVATFPGSQDYSSASDSAPFSISRALPVISVSDAGGIFNGSSFPARATIAGIVSGVDNTPGPNLEGVPLTLTYYVGTSPTGTPLAGPPTNAGSYTVEASFAGSTDYLSLGRFYSFVIFQAAPVFTVSDAGGTFNGSPFPGTGTVAGVVPGVDNTPGSSLEGVNLQLLYFAGDTLSGTPLTGPPSAAGSYAIEAYFPGSTDYSSGGKGYFFVVSQAAPVISLSDPSGTYSSSPFSATATVAGIVAGVDNTPGSSLEGVNLTVSYYAGTNINGTPLSGAPTDAGTYTALASFPGSTDYRPTSKTDVFNISPATPSVTVTDAGGSFTGQPYAASATAKGIGGASVSGNFAFTYYVGSTVNGTGTSTPPSTVGTYTVTAAFTSSNPDYSNASGGPVTFAITQAPPTVSAPSSATLYQNGSLTFSTANGNAIGVADSAASGTSDSITLSVTHGVLKFATTTGLKFTSGSNNSASMTATGTLANLNADLQTLKYTPTSAYIGPDSINIKAADAGDGLSGTASVNLTVFGPPTLTAPSTANVNENAALVFSNSNGNAVTLTDAAATATSDSLTLTVTHGTLGLGSAAGLTFTAGANNSTTMTVTGTLSSLQAALSGLTYTPTTSYSGSASLTVKVKNSASGFNATATVAITVVVPASQPTVTVSTQVPTSVPGEPVPLVIKVSDSNLVANSSNFSLSITFGDGNSAKVTSTNALIVNHVYTKVGTYTVSVTATDEYGHVSTAATTTIHVVAAAVEINPFNPSQTALFVGGTTGKDTVTFTAVSGNQIAVTLNKVSEGTFSTSGPLIVFGQGGADVVNVGAGITNTSYLLETANADNVETDLDNDAIQWAGLSAAVEILNE